MPATERPYWDMPPGAGAGPPAVSTHTITTPSTVNIATLTMIPAGRNVIMELYGGGGGGGGGNTGSNNGGGGGGSGGYVRALIPAATWALGGTIVVGGGGAGGANMAVGVDGQDSTFTSSAIVIVSGSHGHFGNTNGTKGGVGQGNAVAPAVLLNNKTGTAGVNNTTVSGGNGGRLNAPGGGIGGVGSIGATAATAGAQASAGGGGGSVTTPQAGAGGAGKCVLTW